MKSFSGIASSIQSHVQSSKSSLKSAAMSALNSKTGAAVAEQAAKLIPGFSGVDVSSIQNTASALLSGDETAQMEVFQKLASAAEDIDLN